MKTQRTRRRTIQTIVLLMLATVGLGGCAVLAGAAVGGAAGYVIAHEHEHHEFDD